MDLSRHCTIAPIHLELQVSTTVPYGTLRYRYLVLQYVVLYYSCTRAVENTGQYRYLKIPVRVPETRTNTRMPYLSKNEGNQKCY